MRYFIFTLLTLIPPVANARVFSFGDTAMAAYLRGAGQSSAVGDSAWKDSSGVDTTFQNKDAVNYNLSAEFGFLFGFGNSMNMRIGFEGLQTKDQQVSGRNAGGNALMEIQSRAVGFNPNLTFEFNLKNSNSYRFLAIAGAGYTSVKVSNDYTYTPAGTTLYGSASDYKEVVEGVGIEYHGGVGLEFLLVDNVTLLLEAGYKQSVISELTYADTYVTTSGNTVSKGSTAKTEAGIKRQLDLSGEYVGILFRFYIPAFK